MKQTGYIKLYRQMMDDPEYLDEKFDRTHAWIDLLLMAKYEPCTIRLRGIDVRIERGQLNVSIQMLSARWHWAKQTVVNFLKCLENSMQISTQKSNVTTLISITNYELYQEQPSQSGTQNSTQQKKSKEEKESIKLEYNKLYPTLIPKKKISLPKTSKIDENRLLLESRKEAFYNQLKPYVAKYGSAMIEDFFRYWTEPNRSQTKMRFEMEKTWLLTGRLSTWHKRSKPK